MTIEKRKEQEKIRLQNKIIRASIRLFVKEGYENASMRKIAKEINYSPTTIYLYFKNKTELFYHVHEHLFEQLYNQLLSKLDHSSPKNSLVSIAKTFINFAIQNKESYRLMMIINTPSDDIKNENSWNFGIKCLKLMEESIGKTLDVKPSGSDAMESHTFSFLSYIHGISSLAIQGRLPENYKSKIDKLISDSINILEKIS